MAEALWLADDPWRQLSVYEYASAVSWAHADDLDRDLYRQKAKTVIEHLGLTEEGKDGARYGSTLRRFVSKWWEAS